MHQEQIFEAVLPAGSDATPGSYTQVGHIGNFIWDQRWGSSLLIYHYSTYEFEGRILSLETAYWPGYFGREFVHTYASWIGMCLVLFT